MASDKNTHWTEDEDQLEQFVLGRLPDEQRKQLEAHLQGCTQCQEAVRNERQLASGVRQFGRQLLKTQLNERIRAESASVRTSIPWQRIVSAAAVFLIIFGLGYYNHWFTRVGTKETPITRNEELTKSRFDAKEDNVTAKKDEARSAQPNGRDANPPASLEPEWRIRDDKAAANATGRISLSQRDQDRVGESKGLSISPVPLSGAGGIPMKKVLPENESGATKYQLKSEPYWTEGMILQNSNAPTLDQRGPEFNLQKKQLTQPRVSAPQSSTQNSPGSGGRQQNFRILQRSSGSLPVAMQRQITPGAQSVQTLVDQADHRVNLTLFLDSLFSPAELRNASVEEVDPDSIVIGIGSRRIGYRLSNRILEERSDSHKAKEK